MHVALTGPELEEGRARLALMRATVPPATIVRVSETGGQFDRVRPCITSDNLDALCLLPQPDGSWSVAVVFKTAPEGVERVFGSPAAHPYRSSLAAHQGAEQMLAVMLRIAEINAQAPDEPIDITPADELFFLYNHTVPLQAEMVAFCRDSFRRSGALDTPEIQDQARASVARVVGILFPRGFTVAECNAMTDEQQERLLRVLHGAAAAGVWSHPPAPRREATRTEHLAWAKRRAGAVVDRGEVAQGLLVFARLLTQHPGTADIASPAIAAQLLDMGRLRTPAEMRAFFESVE